MTTRQLVVLIPPSKHAESAGGPHATEQDEISWNFKLHLNSVFNSGYSFATEQTLRSGEKTGLPVVGSKISETKTTDFLNRKIGVLINHIML